MSLRTRLVLLCALCPVLGWSASRLTNVSVRSTAGSEADTLIVGFNISGSGSKQLLLRGVGPTLGVFGVAGVVADPELRLFNSTSVGVGSNDNWDGASNIGTVGDSVGAFRLQANSKDAAMLLNLPAGSYSAHLLANSGPGIALLEGYDVDASTSNTQITNISTRSIAGTGAGVLTIGFSITGDAEKTVLIRVVGPTLAGFGVAGTLTNPQLRLFSSRNNELGYNDDWLTSAGWSPAFTSVGAFSLGTAATRDAALLVALRPGNYTAQASGVGNTSGVALIEVYDVPNPPVNSFVFRPVENTTPANYPRTMSSSVATPARVTSQARPVYPFDLRLVGATGDALIQFAVGVDGRVSDAFVVRSHDFRLGESALNAVRQWIFQPARDAAGQPVIQNTQVPIIFTLDGS